VVRAFFGLVFFRNQTGSNLSLIIEEKSGKKKLKKWAKLINGKVET